MIEHFQIIITRACFLHTCISHMFPTFFYLFPVDVIFLKGIDLRDELSSVL